MDTSFWTALNPNIQLLNTKKLMHGQYMYRMSMLSFGSSLLRDPTYLSESIERYNARVYSYGGSWRQKRQLTQKDIELLHLIKSAIAPDFDQIPVDIKTRIEDPYIQFYSSNINTLKDLAQKLKYGDNSHFETIMQPENAESEVLVKQGYVLKKKKIEWPYRLIIRDGRYNVEAKQNLKNYLELLADEIKAPQSLWDQLDKGGWIWGGYIYLKDKQIATMLSMIDANMIGRVEEFKLCALEE
jgi:hypothetical protein